MVRISYHYNDDFVSEMLIVHKIRSQVTMQDSKFMVKVHELITLKTDKWEDCLLMESGFYFNEMFAEMHINTKVVSN